jgi:hypothetical protein
MARLVAMTVHNLGPGSRVQGEENQQLESGFET